MKVSLRKRFMYFLTGDLSYLRNVNWRAKKTRIGLSPDIKKKIKQRDNHTCYYCNNKFSAKKLTVDHYIPYSVSKDHSISNLRTSCQRCNTEKGKINPESPKDQDKWDCFLQTRRTVTTVLNPMNTDKIQAYVNRRSSSFVNKHIDFDTLVRDIEDKLTNHRCEKNIQFSKVTNGHIKKRLPNKYEIIISMNNQINIKNIDSLRRR